MKSLLRPVGVGCGDGAKLAEKLPAPLGDLRREVGQVVGEIQKRGRRGKFLALKKHGDRRREQQNRGEGAQHTGTGLPMQPKSVQRVRDLIVVLQEDHESLGREIEGRRPSAALLPPRPLALIEVAVLRRRDELLRRSRVVGVVRLAPAGERDERVDSGIQLTLNTIATGLRNSG